MLYGQLESAARRGKGLNKVRKSARYETTRFILWSVMDETVRLLHPFIPFVAEEIWKKVPGTHGSIMEAEFPYTVEDRDDPEAEETMRVLMGVVSSIRNIRGEMNVPPSLFVEVTIQSPDKGVRGLLEQRRDMIVSLCRLKSIEVTTPGKRPVSSATSVFGNCSIFVSLRGIIDFELEQGRLNKEIAKITKELDGIYKKLNTEDFLQRAPQEVVEKVREKGDKLVEKRDRLQENLGKLGHLVGNS